MICFVTFCSYFMFCTKQNALPTKETTVKPWLVILLHRSPTFLFFFSLPDSIIPQNVILPHLTLTNHSSDATFSPYFLPNNALCAVRNQTTSRMITSWPLPVSESVLGLERSYCELRHKVCRKQVSVADYFFFSASSSCNMVVYFIYCNESYIAVSNNH